MAQEGLLRFYNPFHISGITLDVHPKSDLSKVKALSRQTFRAKSFPQGKFKFHISAAMLLRARRAVLDTVMRLVILDSRLGRDAVVNNRIS